KTYLFHNNKDKKKNILIKSKHPDAAIPARESPFRARRHSEAAIPARERCSWARIAQNSSVRALKLPSWARERTKTAVLALKRSFGPEKASFRHKFTILSKESENSALRPLTGRAPFHSFERIIVPLICWTNVI
ncbi:MAG: hypothetical protein IJP39_01025, partial [Bacteroidales bacterium]|nr:hypothetical protein [Bacteroidales bacterium]